MNPAALSMLLTSQKPKRKMVVKLPSEGEDAEDQGEVLEQDTIVEQDERATQDQVTSAKDEERSKLLTLRKQWPARRPLTGVDVTQPGPEVPHECLASCQVFPETEDYTNGLPDFIDIYLPVQDAWEVVKEDFARERLESMAKGVQGHAEGLAVGDRNETSPEVSLTCICHRRGQQQQLLMYQLPQLTLLRSDDDKAAAAATPTEERTLADPASEGDKRLTQPNDLILPSSSSSTSAHHHNNNMSLSIPSAGLPFGSSALSAMGLPIEGHRSSSDSELDRQSSPAMGERPLMERGHSEQLDIQGRGQEEKVESLLKELGRGFGYDVDGEHERFTGNKTHSDREDEGEKKDRDGAEDDHHQYEAWQNQRRQVSGNGSEQGEVEADAEAGDSAAISHEYTNPFEDDEERRQRIAKRVAEEDAKEDEKDEVLSRERSGTGETFASSSINAEDEELPLRRYSMLPRGPLDQDLILDDVSHPASYYSTPTQRITRLHADAPIFAPRPQETAPQFHLPTIQPSSLATSGFGHDRSLRRSLNAAAPAFTPSAFTFTAPGDAPRLPSLSQINAEDISQISQEREKMSADEVSRLSQGREKRQRHRNGVEVNEVDLPTVDALPPSTAEAEPSSGIETVYVDTQAGQGSPIASVQESVPRSSFTFKPTAEPFFPSSSSIAAKSVTDLVIPQGELAEEAQQEVQVDIQEEAEEKVQEEVQKEDQEATFDSNVHSSPHRDQEDSSVSMQRSFSNRSMRGKRTPLGSLWQQGDAPAMSSRQNSSSSRLREMLQSSEEADRNAEKDDDDDTISDIIEELGDRMDRALEVWADRILDEVTIMGQIQPAHMVRLDSNEKQGLVDLVTSQVQEIIGNHYRHLTDSLNEITSQQTRILENSVAGSDTTLWTTPRKAVTSKIQGDVDFDYVQEALESKMASLQEHLVAAFESAVPRAMQSISQQVKSTADEAKLDEIVERLESMLSEGKEKAITSQMDMFMLEQVVSTMVQRLQPILQEASESSRQKQRAELIDILEPMLEDRRNRSEVKALADRQDVAQDLAGQIKDHLDGRMLAWEQSLEGIAQGSHEQLQTVLAQSILPQIESLKADQLNIDAMAAKVADILSPVLSTLNDQVKTTTKDGQSDLDSVIGLLDPLVQMHEDSRTLIKRVFERQSDMDQTLERLPMTVNVKLEQFLAAIQQIQDAHQLVLDKMDGLAASSLKGVEETPRIREMELEQIRSDLLQQVDQARKAEMAIRVELMECQTELKAANGFASTLREQCAGLESRLDRAEKDAHDITAKTDNLRQGEQKAVERYLQAEKRVDEAEAETREVQGLLRSNEEQNDLLRRHVEQMAAEAADNREQRARDRESTAQAIAEALASRKEADVALTEERKEKEELMMASRTAENENKKAIGKYAERAAKAEGSVMMLERRIAEQDSKIANLHQITATQKQKAAQGGQKLAEMEKKLKEMEDKERGFVVAHARLAEMEARLRDQDALETGLRSSQENESNLRQELTMHQMRFLDIEREVMSMKENLVDRQLLDQANEQLGHNREEIALLRGQLAELQRRDEDEQRKRFNLPRVKKAPSLETGKSSTVRPIWEKSPSHGSSTWASIHAPNSSIDEMDPTQASYIEDSFESFIAASRNQLDSHSSTSRVIEVDEEGWWN